MTGSVLDLLILVPADFIYRRPEESIPTYSEERTLPYGALALASFLRNCGQRVMVAPLQHYYQDQGCYLYFDDGTPRSQAAFSAQTGKILSALLERLRPRAVGLSINYAIHHRAAEITLDLLREGWPHLPVLAGGNHATYTYSFWLKRKQPVDAVVLGEGERTCLAWLRSGLDSAPDVGLAQRGDDGSVHCGAPPERLSRTELSIPVDLSLAALPRWAPLERFEHLLATSRGCNYRCAFCTSRSMWAKRRQRDMTAVRREVADLYAHGLRRALLADDMIDMNSSSFQALATTMADFGDFRLGAPIRFDVLARGDVRLLAQAGIDHAFIGLESFSNKVLQAMNKKLQLGDVGQVEGQLSRLREAGLQATLFMLIGHPGSSFDIDMESAGHCRRLVEQGLLAGLSAVHVVPYPGTALARMADSGQIRVIESRPNRWTMNEPLIELLDERGRVSYSAEQMRLVFREYLDIQDRCQRIAGQGSGENHATT